MSRFLILSVSLVFLSIVCFSTGCNYSSSNLSITITYPADSTVCKNNLLNITGMVSDPSAIVVIHNYFKVNNSPSGDSITVPIDKDGGFSGYVELTEGENTIEVSATLSSKKASDSIKVYHCEIPLAITIQENGSYGIDYTKTPLPIYGVVTAPDATVTINNQPVTVSADGTFHDAVQLSVGQNVIEAKAVKGDEEDSWIIPLDLDENGILGYVPGTGSLYLSRITLDNSITVKRGESKNLEITLQADKDLPGLKPKTLSHTVYLVDDIYSTNTLPLPKGMSLSISPSSLTVFPKTIYNTTLIIKTTNELEPGTYFLLLNSELEQTFNTSGWITVTVED
ncbi:MAG: hypothetical protein U9N44_01240 [Chloroflexota bacterium]|nr:hypothetical protein [Chloroflexota bacterium]